VEEYFATWPWMNDFWMIKMDELLQKMDAKLIRNHG
jgi:hypothetical protein